VPLLSKPRVLFMSSTLYSPPAERKTDERQVLGPFSHLPAGEGARDTQARRRAVARAVVTSIAKGVGASVMRCAGNVGVKNERVLLLTASRWGAIPFLGKNIVWRYDRSFGDRL